MTVGKKHWPDPRAAQVNRLRRKHALPESLAHVIARHHFGDMR